MALEPLNYLRQAQESLAQMWLPWARKYHPRDAQAGEALLQAARQAPKFLLPRGGRLLNDALRGLPSMPRLPFETLVIEYEGNAEGQGIVEQVYESEAVSCPRRIVVAWQEPGSPSIFVQAIFYIASEAGATWTITPYFMEVSPEPLGQPAAAPTYNGKPILPHLLNKNTPTSHLALQVHAVGTLAQQTSERWQESAYLDMLDEVSAVLELIEALSCSNVRHEPLPTRKLNKAAARRGALPFDEYRILTVLSANSSGEPSQQISSGHGSHRSPREHLRRGHIRVYGDGRQIWINQTVVNAGVGGRISSVRDMRPGVGP